MTPTDWFGRARRLPSFSTAVALVFVGCVAAATPLFAQSASTAEKTPQANLGQTKSPEIGKSLYSRENLVAWCIVPFDSKRRSPEERAAMLERLGFKRFAYDWRAETCPSFDAEIEALERHGIGLEAFWVAPGELNRESQIILDLLKTARDQNAALGHCSTWAPIHAGVRSKAPGRGCRAKAPPARRGGRQDRLLAGSLQPRRLVWRAGEPDCDHRAAQGVRE